MNYPLVSVITVVYNAHATLEKTIKSVVDQDKKLFEYWIIDGGSTDGSVELIRKYEKKLAGWISEPDKGIYDAMNKGIELSKGEWLYFLGADDELAEGIFTTLASHLTPTNKIVFGDVLFENGYRMLSYLKLRTWIQNTLHHQSAFYNRSLFDSFRYDTSLRTMADYELNLLAYVQKFPVKYIPAIVAHCRTGGASSHLSLGLKETNYIRNRYLGNRWKNTVLSFILGLYYAQKQFRKHLFGHKI